MGLCVLYYVEYSLYDVKKVGFFYLGWNYTLKFDENGRNFSKRVENTAGKGEIARYEQFLFFPQCFQKTCTADT